MHEKGPGTETFCPDNSILYNRLILLRHRQWNDTRLYTLSTRFLINVAEENVIIINYTDIPDSESMDSTLASFNFCLLFFSFWCMALRKFSSFLLIGEGREELSARLCSGISSDSCWRRSAVLLWGGLLSVGERLSECNGLISCAVAIAGIVAIVKTVIVYSR